MCILIKTQRLFIRELDEADVAAEFELFEHPSLTEYIDGLLSYEEEVRLRTEYREYVYERYGYGIWGLFDRKSGRLIGEAGLEHRAGLDKEKYPYKWMSDEHSAEIGFCIAHDLWGQGYCTEAAAAIIAYCHDHFGIDTIFARVDKRNIRSVRVLMKLGFFMTDDGFRVLNLSAT